MRSDPTILAFDTSAAHCAAALLLKGEIRSETQQQMNRGQAEALMPILEETLAAHRLGWGDLDALAVGVGPGNFTGIRISVSAARGLALALGIPAIGISMFEVMGDGANGACPPGALTFVTLPAPREMAYLQAFRNGRADGAPHLIDPTAPSADLPTAPDLHVIGHAAEPIARALGATSVAAEITDLPRRLARIAERRFITERAPPARPVPLYVRPPDAAPPSDPPPVILP